MKMPQKSVHCSRCGDELSADEISQLEGSICAFCDHIRTEAQQTHELRLANRKLNVVKRPRIAAKSSDNRSINFDLPLLPKIIRPTT